MKKLVAPVLGLALVAALAAGCGKTSDVQPQASAVTPTAEDVSQVNDALAANMPYVEENEYESGDPAELDPAQGFGANHPVFWWRTIRSVTRRYETTFADPDSNGRPTTAYVDVNKRLLGTFNVLMGDSASTPDSLVRKPLDDHWQRRLVFRRSPADSNANPRAMWRLAGTSGVEVTSANSVTRIRSVRVQAGALDTTITDPLQMHRLRRVLYIPVNTPVTVTVTTASPNDLVLLYRWHHRFRFHNNGDNSYTYQWTTSNDPGLRHFGVNALSWGTIFDASAPYDSHAWLFPFVVNPGEASFGL